jgi:alpha-ketoglutarate-dependent taurine dioxygenase
VLLKRAAQSPEAFEAVTDRFADHFRIHQDPTRHRYNATDTTQSVTGGSDAIGLHAERAYLPGRPELLFFCCLTPPTSGGATTLCDGAAIVDTLSAEDVRRLETMTLRWTATLNRLMWQRMWNSEDRAEMLARFDAATERYGEQPRTRRWFEDTDSPTETNARTNTATNATTEQDTLHVDYVVPALSTGRLSGRKAFANYLLLAQDEPDGPSATLVRTPEREALVADDVLESPSGASTREGEDDAPVPRDLLRRVGEAADAQTIDVAWEQGDIAIIDNTRCMHGRRAFSGGARQILVRMGDARLPHP